MNSWFIVAWPVKVSDVCETMRDNSLGHVDRCMTFLAGHCQWRGGIPEGIIDIVCVETYRDGIKLQSTSFRGFITVNTHGYSVAPSLGFCSTPLGCGIGIGAVFGTSAGSGTGMGGAAVGTAMTNPSGCCCCCSGSTGMAFM